MSYSIYDGIMLKSDLIPNFSVRITLSNFRPAILMLIAAILLLVYHQQKPVTRVWDKFEAFSNQKLFLTKANYHDDGSSLIYQELSSIHSCADLGEILTNATFAHYFYMLVYVPSWVLNPRSRYHEFDIPISEVSNFSVLPHFERKAVFYRQVCSSCVRLLFLDRTPSSEKALRDAAWRTNGKALNYLGFLCGDSFDSRPKIESTE